MPRESRIVAPAKAGAQSQETEISRVRGNDGTSRDHSFTTLPWDNGKPSWTASRSPRVSVTQP
jgi:hypothetical protein